MAIEPTNNIYGVPGIRKQENTPGSQQKKKKPGKNEQNTEKSGTERKPIIDIRV